MTLASGVHFLPPTGPVHVFDSGVPGATALIQAGIHGDEVAGVHALQELLEEGLTPRRGRLLVIPIMNAAAYRARQRSAPGGLDLNRCFPGDASAPEREKRLARQFMDLVMDERPALMATLHESQKRYDPAVTPSFGQTLVYGVERMTYGELERASNRLARVLREARKQGVKQPIIGETNVMERDGAMIAVRPERIQIRRDENGGAGGVPGEVVTTMVIGPAVQCLVRGDNGQEILARQQRNGGESPLESLRAGERVYVYWAEDAELVLARERGRENG
jgi:hypothetical protein